MKLRACEPRQARATRVCGRDGRNAGVGSLRAQIGLCRWRPAPENGAGDKPIITASKRSTRTRSSPTARGVEHEVVIDRGMPHLRTKLFSTDIPHVPRDASSSGNPMRLGRSMEPYSLAVEIRERQRRRCPWRL
jgi:hypothetical protein